MTLQASNPACIWDAKAQLGEGPLYDPNNSLILWLDILKENLYTYNIVSEDKNTWHVPGVVSAIGLAENNTYISAGKNGFGTLVFGKDGQPELQPLFDPEVDQPENRFNDGKVDPSGGFWAGTMDAAEKNDRAGNWWRLAPSGKVFKLDSGYHVTNGPAFDPARNRAFFTDSARRVIYVADISDAGSIQNKSVFRTFSSEHGYPDGMTVDITGHVWVAFWDGHCIRRFDPGGNITEEIAMPVPRPTSIVIAGTTAYVTSATTGLDSAALERAPLSGGLFSIELNEDIGAEPFVFADTTRELNGSQ